MRKSDKGKGPFKKCYFSLSRNNINSLQKNEMIHFITTIETYLIEHGYDDALEKFRKNLTFFNVDYKQRKIKSALQSVEDFKKEFEIYYYETLPIQTFLHRFQHIKFHQFFEMLAGELTREEILEKFISTFMKNLPVKQLHKSSQKILAQFIFQKATEYAVDSLP